MCGKTLYMMSMSKSGQPKSYLGGCNVKCITMDMTEISLQWKDLVEKATIDKQKINPRCRGG